MFGELSGGLEASSWSLNVLFRGKIYGFLQLDIFHIFYKKLVIDLDSEPEKIKINKMPYSGSVFRNSVLNTCYTVT
jgi:hypothetical protein